MNNVAFLVIAVGVATIASTFLWLRTRRPTTFMSSIDSFQQEMKALGRDPHAEMAPPRRPTVLRPIVPSQGSNGVADKFRAARQAAGGELADRRGARRDRKRVGGGWDDGS